MNALLFYYEAALQIRMMVLFHVFENIGAIIELLPLTVISLTFISLGGSFLIGNMIGIGLIMVMRYEFQPETKRGFRPSYE